MAKYVVAYITVLFVVALVAVSVVGTNFMMGGGVQGMAVPPPRFAPIEPGNFTPTEFPIRMWVWSEFDTPSIPPHSACWTTRDLGECFDGSDTGYPIFEHTSEIPVHVWFDLQWDVTVTVYDELTGCLAYQQSYPATDQVFLEPLGPVGTYRVHISGSNRQADGHWTIGIENLIQDGPRGDC